MACGCSKRKNSNNANAQRRQRVDTVKYAPAPTEGLAGDHALSGTAYRRVIYLVLPKAKIEVDDFTEAERYNVLHEARNRVKALGPAYGIKTTRAD